MTLPFDIERPLAEVSGYRFDRSHLNANHRTPGISAFMRIRNGGDFLEATLRSHLARFDEIVAVYNQCTDNTPEILNRLQQEFGVDRLRVIHYTDRVFPPGSQGHLRTSPDSPNSLVNYYNFSLAATRREWVTKLDDDHLAIDSQLKEITDAIRSGDAPSNAMLCFSGLNLARRADGRLGVLESSPISGSGDIGFFRVTPRTHFKHDRRFERFRRGGARRQFVGFLYWHLKLLKQDVFGNYDLHENPHSRMARQKAKHDAQTRRFLEPTELAEHLRPTMLRRTLALISGKHSVIAARDLAVATTFPDPTIDDAVRRTASIELLERTTQTNQTRAIA